MGSEVNLCVSVRVLSGSRDHSVSQGRRARLVSVETTVPRADKEREALQVPLAAWETKEIQGRMDPR